MTEERQGLAEVEPETLTDEEKQLYLMGLVTVAREDGHFHPEEKAYIARAADRLEVRLTPEDLDTWDLDRLLGGIRRPAVRRALFKDMAAMAAWADEGLSAEELAILKTIATEWALELPPLPAVEWKQVEVLEGPSREELGRRLRPLLRQRKRRAVRSTGLGLGIKTIAGAMAIFIGCMVAIAVVAGANERELGQRVVITYADLLWALPPVVTGIVVGVFSGGRAIWQTGIAVFVASVVATLQWGDPNPLPIHLLQAVGATVLGMFGATVGTRLKES